MLELKLLHVSKRPPGDYFIRKNTIDKARFIVSSLVGKKKEFYRMLWKVYEDIKYRVITVTSQERHGVSDIKLGRLFNCF